MRKIFLAAAAVPALFLASDAAAQSRGQVRGEVAIENRIANLEARVEAGVQAGAIDRREARNLRREVRDLRMLEASYSRDGLSRQERQTLQQRLRSVSANVRLAGGDDWSNRYGWNDNDWDDDSRYGGWDDRTDRYGNRVGDVYDGRGGPYEPVTTERPGLGTVLNNLINGRRLDRVPSQYSSQYRDRSDVYFRSDGRQIYEIDARTNRVIRVHPIR